MSERTITGTSDADEALLFHIDAERFAVALAVADEALERPVIEPMPGAGSALAGLTRWRGALLPVYHPEPFLGVAPGTERGVLLVLRGASRSIGLLVDDVDDVVRIDRAHLRPAPGPVGADPIVVGVARRAGELVAVVDAAALERACAAAEPTPSGPASIIAA